MGNVRQITSYVEARIRTAVANERGDVPGWVMITLMTCAIAAILWGLAGDWLANIFNDSMTAVDGTIKDNPGSDVKRG